MKGFKRTLIAGILATLALGLVACNRKAAEEKAQIHKDLELVCHTQRDYLESRKLLKGVNSRDLAEERTRKLEQELRSAAVRAILAGATKDGLAHSHAQLEKIAQDSGLSDWNCPELDKL